MPSVQNCLYQLLTWLDNEQTKSNPKKQTKQGKILLADTEKTAKMENIKKTKSKPKPTQIITTQSFL